MKELIDKLNKNMTASISSYKEDLEGIRAGRASASLLNTITVKAYGSSVPINQLASVNVQDSKSIMVQVWDSANVDAAYNAIVNSDLGINPTVEGSVLRIALPPLTAERREQLVKLARQCAEKCRISLRNVRRNIIEEIKDSSETNSEDDVRLYTKKVQDVTEGFVKQVDDILAKKEIDIKNV